MTTFLCLTDPEPACYLLLARCEAGEIVCFKQVLRLQRLNVQRHNCDNQLMRK